MRQTATRSFAVDTSGADTEVWLVKVPAVIAELVRASDSGASLGSFTLVESASPANSGARKRQRPTLQVRLDPAAVAAASGSDAVHRVPQSYVLALDEPTGTRVMEQDAARGPFNFIGVSSRSGNMVPDAKDPAYTAFAAHRRQAELQGQAQRRGTVLAPDPAASEGGPAAVAAAARIAATLAAAASGTGARARAPVARAASIYALFERGAYWTLRDMADATGRREVSKRSGVWLKVRMRRAAVR